MNAPRSPGLEASPVRLESQGGPFPLDGAEADASRLLWRKASEFAMARKIPAGASGASWPCPQTNDIIFPTESSTYSLPSLKHYP